MSQSCGRQAIGKRSRLILCISAVLVAGAGMPVLAFNPLQGDYSKADPQAVRIVTYNTLQRFISDPSADAAFQRVLVVLSPDVICFQEILSDVSNSNLVARLNAILPVTGSTWRVQSSLTAGSRAVIASRFPLSMGRTDTNPPSSTRGVAIALADLPDTIYTRDLYLLGVHLKCCNGTDNEASRQRSADAIAAWLGDARTAGGLVTLPANTPMVVLGDFNLVDGEQPGNTILTGNILDEAIFGPDIKGDWDVSNLADASPADPFTGDHDTWRSSSTHPSDRLDRFFYTDSAATIAGKFILNTLTMTTNARTAAGLLAGDTTPDNTADHLPAVIDLLPPLVSGCGGGNCSPPAITTAVSRRTHAGAGSFDIDLLHGGLDGDPGTESREGGPRRLLVTFDQTIQGSGGLDTGDVSLSSGNVTFVNVTGSLLLVDLNSAADGQNLTVAFPGIENNSGQKVTETLSFGVLAGDINRDGRVNLIDAAGVKVLLSSGVSAATFRFDANVDGTIDLIDVAAVRSRHGGRLGGE